MSRNVGPGGAQGSPASRSFSSDFEESKRSRKRGKKNKQQQKQPQAASESEVAAAVVGVTPLRAQQPSTSSAGSTPYSKSSWVELSQAPAFSREPDFEQAPKKSKKPKKKKKKSTPGSTACSGQDSDSGPIENPVKSESEPDFEQAPKESKKPKKKREKGKMKDVALDIDLQAVADIVENDEILSKAEMEDVSELVLDAVIPSLEAPHLACERFPRKESSNSESSAGGSDDDVGLRAPFTQKLTSTPIQSVPVKEMAAEGGGDTSDTAGEVPGRAAEGGGDTSDASGDVQGSRREAEDSDGSGDVTTSESEQDVEETDEEEHISDQESTGAFTDPGEDYVWAPIPIKLSKRRKLSEDSIREEPARRQNEKDLLNLQKSMVKQNPERFWTSKKNELLTGKLGTKTADTQRQARICPVAGCYRVFDSAPCTWRHLQEKHRRVLGAQFELPMCKRIEARSCTGGRRHSPLELETNLKYLKVHHELTMNQLAAVRRIIEDQCAGHLTLYGDAQRYPFPSLKELQHHCDMAGRRYRQRRIIVEAFELKQRKQKQAGKKRTKSASTTPPTVKKSR